MNQQRNQKDSEKKQKEEGLEKRDHDNWPRRKEGRKNPGPSPERYVYAWEKRGPDLAVPRR